MISVLIDRANLVTTIGLMCGVFSVIFTVNQEWELSILLMLLAVFCDVSDGIVARRFRKIKDELLSKIGVQFDSLADLIHSGIAPGLFIYYYTGQTLISTALLIIMVIACFLRLAYFNCVGLTDDGYFYGVPVFYSPMLLAVVLFLAITYSTNIILYFYAIIIPALQVSSAIRIKKFKGTGFYIFMVILISEVLFYSYHVYF